VLQAAVCDGEALDVLTFCEDCLSSPEVDIGRSEIVDALVIADMVIVRNEGVDLPFEITGQKRTANSRGDSSGISSARSMI
jgi:hypothetical protein